MFRTSITGCFGILASLFLASGGYAQQPNSPQASFSFNGGNGPPWPYSVTVNTASQFSLTLTVSGAPNAGYAMAECSGIGAPGIPSPFGLIDLDLSQGFSILMDGVFFSTGTLFDALAHTGPTGTSTWTVNVTPAASGFSGAFQCLVADSASSSGYTLTAAANVAIVSLGPPFAAIFVSATTGAPGNPGTIGAPLSTIADGIAASVAAGAPYPTVVVAAGNYASTSTLAIANGVSVSGGYDPLTWSQSPALTSTLTVSNGSAVLANGINSTTVLDRLTIVGGNGFTSGSAYGVRVAGSTSLVLQSCTIFAGNGGNGSNGNFTSGSAQPGNDGILGNGGCESGNFPCGNCPQPGGGAGGTSTVPTAVGGTGGAPGNGSSSGSAGQAGGGGAAGGPGTPAGNGNWNTPMAYWGANGAPGTNGLNGSAGAPAYQSNGYLPTGGANGVTGTRGDGGGGGGGGGGGSLNCDSWGGRGGGGGAGGFAGAAGFGGTSAGGSFAVYIGNSNVVVDSCELHSGSGGNGGNGGNGQPGGLGGQGAHVTSANTGAGNSYGGGGAQDDGSNGGRGGNGGQGGSGGSGGGGAGGPSWCIRYFGTAPTINNVTFFVGTPGNGGTGGGTAPSGPPGTSGQVGN